MEGVRVDVRGLREFRTALRRTDGALPREMRKGFNQVGKIIVADAKPRTPRRSGTLARSMRAQSTQTEGRVVLGNDKTPYVNAVYWGTGPRRGKKGPHNIPRRAVMHEAAQRQQVPIIVALRAVLGELAKKLEE